MPCILVKWIFNVFTWNPSPHEYEAALGIIPAMERERIYRFRHRDDALRSLAGVLMVYRFLKEHYHCQITEVTWQRTEHGRPYVRVATADLRQLDFNLSHHGDWVVLVAGTQCHVGVDVVKTDEPLEQKERLHFMQSLRHYLSERDWEDVTASSTIGEQLETLYVKWALKEAYGKALGEGVVNDAVVLKLIEFQENEGKTPARLTLKGQLLTPPWQFRIQSIAPQYLVAVGVLPFDHEKIENLPGLEEPFQLIEPTNLLNFY